MDIPEDIFVNRLLILKADGSERQFAARIGVSCGTAHNYLKGKSEPKVTTLKKISKEYNVSLEWLMKGEVPCSQKVDENIVAESDSLYGKKLPPEEERFAQIQAYIEEVRVAGPMAQALFNEKFIECFKSFEDWSAGTRKRIKK